jgi:hypothetical protein
MALEKQNVSISLVKGVETKSDKKQQVPGSLTLLENGRFTTPGKIRKRAGHDALGQTVLGGSTEISNGAGITAFMDELLESNGETLYSYSEGNDQWAEKGPLYNLNVTADSVIRNNYQQTSQDSCIHSSGIQCFVWEDSSGGCRYSIIDYETKLQIVTNVLIASDGTKPKCYALGNYIAILYYDTSETDINLLAIPAATPTSSGSTANAATDPANDVYDAAIIGDRLFLTYNNNSGNLATRYINAVLTASSAVTIASTVATCITVFGDASQRVWVALWNGTAVKTAIYDYSLNVVRSIITGETVSNVKNITGAVIDDDNFCYLYYDITAAAQYDYLIRSQAFYTDGTTASAAVFIRSLSLASKAFVYNSQIYMLGSYASQYQPTYFLMNNSEDVAAKISPLSGGGVAAKAVIPQVNEVSTGIYQLTYLQKNTTNAVNGLIVSQTGIQQATIDFTHLGLFSADLANNLHVGGGYLILYDGASVTEHGFHYFPEAVTLTGSNGAGTIANGTYEYVAVYSWIDNFGQIHRSAPSIAASIVLTGVNDTVTVDVPTLRVTSKSNVTIEIYRTENAGSTFYMITSLTSPTFNSKTADTVSFTDTYPDASIIGNTQLYTTGGEAENISLPATEVFTNYKNRIVAIPSENKSQWWYSKSVVPFRPVEFSDQFVNNMDQYGGDLTAVGVSDDKIIFFKRNTKFYVYGNGPAASGANDDFSNPERITGDTGCTNQRSIVSTPVGLMYQSPKGIYLLERSLVDKYIGSPVEDYTTGALVTSAVLMANENQVRMTLDSGVTLVYDYFVDQWNVDTGLNAQDSCLWQGETYAIVQTSGRVLVENPDIYADAGQFIKLKIRTGWISFAQLQGYQRAWKMLLLGEYKSPHRLIINVAENFNPSPFQQVYINAGEDLEPDAYGDTSPYGDELYYGGAFPSYNFRIFLERQKCTSIQITIEDTQRSNFGEGYSLSNIAFEVGVKKGLNKLKAGASYG